MWRVEKYTGFIQGFAHESYPPGPMTIVDTAADQYYHNSKILGNVLAKIINREIKALESAGCKYIQVSDELVGRGGEPEGWRGG